jgi:hypothetical protein
MISGQAEEISALIIATNTSLHAAKILARDPQEPSDDEMMMTRMMMNKMMTKRMTRRMGHPTSMNDDKDSDEPEDDEEMTTSVIMM